MAVASDMLRLATSAACCLRESRNSPSGRLADVSLSSYQMNGEKAEEKFLVDQVVVLADRLSNAWYQGNRLPFNVSASPS